MGTGQLMLTLGAMILLSTTILNINRNLLATGDVMYTNKYQLLAVSIATSMVEEANNKAFDHKTDTSAVYTTAGLSTTLGAESGETYTSYNDFDDFNNYTKTDSTMPSAVFNVRCQVVYVSPTAPDSVKSTPTFHKRINVFVTSNFMVVNGIRDTVKMSSVFSYWYYR